MADKKEAAPEKAPAAEAAPPKKKKTLVFAGGGTAAVLALAFAASLMAVPRKEQAPELEGPFVAKLSKTDLQANLAGADGKRYVVLSLQAEYYAYDESYVQGRLGGGSGGGHGGAAAEDPLYLAMLKDALLTLAATKTLNQVTDPMLIDTFLDEIRAAVDPVLFPVCIGDSHAPQVADSKSGLRVGESSMESTMRGLLHEHSLDVDAAKKTIQLDDGPALPLKRERDLKVGNRKGEYVYVDATRLDPNYSGQVPVGVPGRVRRIFKDSFLVQ